MIRTLIVTVFMLCASLHATTYYISSSSGADTSSTVQAQSKSTPWAHLPGMANATSNASTYTPVAGDTFILRGCDSWTNASFPITWAFAGTNGNPITIGVDKTWQNTTNCAVNWNRPIFDGGGTLIGGTHEFFHGATGISDVTLDNIEAKGFFWNTLNGGNLISMFCFGNCASGTHRITVTNFYVHGWSHTALDSGGDVCTVFQGASTSPFSADFDFEHIVVDGSDSTNSGDSCRTFEFIGGTIKYNFIKAASNGIRPAGGGEIAYNNISVRTSFDVTIHENAIETQVSNQTFLIHDNVIHDMSAGEGLQICGPGETDTVWNNVFSLSGGGNPPAIPRNDGIAVACTAITLWNNTIVPQSGVNCVHQTGFAGSTIGTLVTQNNHCITTASFNDSFAGVATSFTSDHNTLMTPTTATSQGYTSAEAFQYSPTLSNNSTVGAGTNLTSSWPGGQSTNDTQYACTEQTLLSVVQVVCPARSGGTRTTGSTAWDTGAYEFVISPTNSPSAPALGMFSWMRFTDYQYAGY